MTATQRIYQAAQVQCATYEHRGQCRTCGADGLGVPFEKWVKDSFNDRDKLHAGGIVCEACLFCFSDQNAELQARLGKEKTQKFRNYSHFVVDSEWIPLSKGNKAQMASLLLDRQPAVAVIADSGQKHIAFRAQPGWWQFEEYRLLPEPDTLRELLRRIERLYQAGASKAEIESGHYDQRTIRRIGIGNWQNAESQIKSQRGGLLFKLAIFLAQKEADDSRTDSE